MSTNYYWIFEDPKPQYILLPTGTKVKCHDTDVPYAGTHVGKRYGFKWDHPAMEGPNTAFIFACDPMLVLECVKAKSMFRPGEKIVEDEYGRQFTAKDFSILLYDCQKWELHSIGEVFC